MGRAGAVAILASALVLGVAPGARAQPCAGLVDAGPLLAGPGATDFGQVAEACPGTDLFLRGRGELVIDQVDLYGVITAAGTLRGRWALSSRWLLSAAIDPATMRHPINSVISSTAIDVGPATVGVQRSFAWQRTALGVYGRALLPLDSARHQGSRLGAELGATVARHLRKRWSARAGLSLPATLTLIGGVGHYSFSPGALAEAAFAPRPWVAFSLGAATRMQLRPWATVLAVAARPAARLQTRGGWHVALASDLPFAGSDRTDLTVTVFVGRGPARGDD
jgi:hypothetical protein